MANSAQMHRLCAEETRADVRHRDMRVRCVDYLGWARRTARYWRVYDIEYLHSDNACLVSWVLRLIKPI
jgi:hypothetical protein